MRFLKITLIVLLIAANTVEAQVDLGTSDFQFSNLIDNNLNQQASIDFRTLDQKNLAITSPIGWLNDGGPISTTMTVSLVDDFSSLDKSLDISTSIAATAKYLKYSGSASYSSSFQNSYKTDDHSISIVVKLESNYGKYGFLDPVMKPEYKALLDSSKFDVFVQRCGTHFVRQSERVVRALAVINIRNLDQSTKEKLTNVYKGKVSGSYGNFAGSLEATSSLQKLINTATKVTEVEVNFQAVGGGGTPALAPLIENINKTDVSALLHALAQFVRSGTKDNSAPASYYLTSYSQYGLKMNKPYGYDPAYIEAIYNAVIKITSSSEELARIKDSRPEYQSYYNRLSAEYGRLGLIYKNLLGQCIESSNCGMELPVLEKIYWPETVVSDEDFSVHPTYIEMNKVTNGSRDRILYNLTIRLEGMTLFPEYYNRIEFYYVNDNGDLNEIPNFVAGNRLILDYPVDYADIRARSFLAQVDTKSADFDKDSNGYVISNQSNINKANAILENLSRREYYIKSFTTDGKESMTYLGRLNLSNVDPLIRTY